MVSLCVSCTQPKNTLPFKVARMESDLLERIVTFVTLPITNDYSKSSESSKRRLLPYLQDALSTVMWNNYVTGWAMLSLRGERIFLLGEVSELIVSTEICSINGILNRYSGYCAGDFIIYIDENLFKKYHKDLTINCEQCTYPLFSSRINETVKIISNIYVECEVCLNN